jgi:hypothetical protein
MEPEISFEVDRELRLAYLSIVDPASGITFEKFLGVEEMRALRDQFLRAKDDMASGARTAHIDLRTILDH